MIISNFMTKHPYYLSPKDRIIDVAHLLIEKSINAIPILENGLFVGLICKRQLYQAIAYGLDFNTTIDMIMITEVITCKPDDSIDVFINGNLSQMPVVVNNKLLGIITKTDIIRYFEYEIKNLESIKIIMKQMNAIFEASYDYLFVTDAEGVVTKVSPSYYRITGIKPEDILGSTMYNLVALGFYDRSCSIEVIETLKPVTFVQHILKTGRTVLVTGNPVFDENGRLISVVTNGRDITELNQLKDQVEHIESLSRHYKKELARFEVLTGKDYVFASKAMVDLMEKVSHIAQFDSVVLINGESGVGKEIIANQIHMQSPRFEKPYIRINCAAIPETLLESELFGYVDGAFTGAKKGGKMGVFELADSGTLLLDEIGELPFSMQSKLLRVLQENEITRIGATSPISIDVRLIASTNRDLKEMVKNNEFRTDLFFRLNVIPITVPPLRERKEEIPYLANHFLDRYNAKYELNKILDQKLILKLYNYEWPGNIRELQNLIERAIVYNTGDLIEEIPLENDSDIYEINDLFDVNTYGNLRDTVEEIEKLFIKTSFDRYGSTRKAADAIGISQSTFCRKAANYNINLADSK